MWFKRATPWALAFMLAACGDGAETSDSSAHEQAIARAEAKEVEARGLGLASPCTQVSQCTTLDFLSARGPCPNWTYHPYSTAAPSAAAASAARLEQHALANEAHRLAPPSGIVCVASVSPAPALACIAGRCQAVD